MRNTCEKLRFFLKNVEGTVYWLVGKSETDVTYEYSRLKRLDDMAFIAKKDDKDRLEGISALRFSFPPQE